MSRTSDKSQLYKTEEIKEKVILVGVEQNLDTIDINNSLDELDELINTAGAESVSRIIQKREKIHPAHYIGKGKIEELKIMIDSYEATGIVCDDELSPAQFKNLEKLLNTKIMDRTMIILDIFASRALSSEGKIQVELAQLKYKLSRLSGIGSSMSKLGGGIGTRGPGETKLENDRRYIKERISELNKELKNIEIHRNLLREQRIKKGTPVISLIGYTNAGKSTLLNKLTDANVIAENKLFATLDTTTRKLKLPNGSEVFIIDTVGFIKKLPHNLIKAFKSTLEEIKYSDILLHIVDISNNQANVQIDVVYKTLEDLQFDKIPIITVYNKIDKNNMDFHIPVDNKAYSITKISSKTGEGIENMLIKIELLLKSFRKKMNVLIPYSDGHLLKNIYGKCEIISEQHIENGYLIELFTNNEIYNKLKSYIYK